MMGIVDFFTYEAPNVAYSKSLNTTEIPMVTSYARQAHLAVILFLSFNLSIYDNLVEDTGNIYAMGKDNYPRTLPKIKNIFSKWQNSAWMTTRPPTGGLDFAQEWMIDGGTGPTKGDQSRRQRRGERDIFMNKFYKCNRY